MKKINFRALSNEDLDGLIERRTQELIELRNEKARRSGEKPPKVNYDFTKTLTD